MTLRLNGSTSGYTQIDAAAVAGDNSITLPTLSGAITIKDSSGNTEVGTGVTFNNPSANVFAISNSGGERLRIDSAGSITAGGSIVSGANPNLGGNSGVQIVNDGVLRVAKASGNIFEVWTTGSSSRMVAIKADGGASFAATNVNINKVTDGANFNVRNDATSAEAAIEVYKGGFTTNERKVLINNDGSATFSGYGDFIRSAADGFGYLGIGPGGTDEKATFVNRGGEIALELYQNFSSSPKVTIKSDGSSSFTGDLFIGGTSDANADFVVDTGSRASFYRTLFFAGTDSSSSTIELNTSGLVTLGSASNSTNNNGLYLGGQNGSFNLYTTRYSTDCFQILNTSGSGTNRALKVYGNGDVEIGGIIQTNTQSAGNIELDSTGAFTTPKIKLHASGTAEFRNEVYVHGSDASTQRYLNFSRPTSGQYRATLRRDAWYLGETVTSIGNVTPSGSNIILYMNGNASFSGSVSKGSGSFKIDHPLVGLTTSHHLVHSFIEGPQADLIYRGVVDLVDGTATVNIDTVGRMTEGTFAALCTNVSCFTSNESDWTAVKGSVTGNVLTITAQDNTSTATVSWMVVGERKDQHMIDTEWTDENGRVITEPLKS